MQYYVVTFTHTRIFGWLVYLYAHIRYLKKLIRQGKLQISGPGVGTPVRSAQLVFNVTDREELDRLVAADPYSVHDLVASSTVNLWDVKYGSMLRPATPDKKGTKYFRATFELKDDADKGNVEQERDAYLKQLLSERKMRAAGSYANRPSAGLMILSARDADEAADIMKNDPYVARLGATFRVIQWDPRFGDF